MHRISHHTPNLGAIATAAIDVAGGGAALARACGVTRCAVQQWKRRGIPLHQLRAVAKLTNMEPAALRPDAAEHMRSPVAA